MDSVFTRFGSLPEMLMFNTHIQHPAPYRDAEMIDYTSQ